MSTKVGLALGGGFVLGAAHIGVLRAMEEKGFQLAAISGTSVGALVAAFYAFGIPPHEIEEMAASSHWFDISSLQLTRFSLLSNDRLAKIIRTRLGDVNIEDARIPLSIVATDLITGERVVLERGNLAEAVRASTSIPGIYAPVEIHGRLLVDGGLVENVPISPLKQRGVDFTIAVDVGANRRFQKPENIMDVIANSISISIRQSTRTQWRQADLVIAPDMTARSRVNMQQVRELAKVGYDEAMNRLGQVTAAPSLMSRMKKQLANWGKSE